MPNPKIRYGGLSAIEKMEEAAGITEEKPAPPPAKTTPPSGKSFTPPPWTGPKPWKKLQDRSTEGSPAFSKKELEQGYRKI